MSDEEKREPSSPEEIQAALTGGVPLGRWKEGLLFEGIEPTPGLKSSANWFPRTETLGPDEMRIAAAAANNRPLDGGYHREHERQDGGWQRPCLVVRYVAA